MFDIRHTGSPVHTLCHENKQPVHSIRTMITPDNTKVIILHYILWAALELIGMDCTFCRYLLAPPSVDCHFGHIRKHIQQMIPHQH